MVPMFEMTMEERPWKSNKAKEIDIGNDLTEDDRPEGEVG
jgi:hypothetical protein